MTGYSITIFVKARLNCSAPGLYPFYFNQIQSVSLVSRAGVTERVIAVFNTPENSITGKEIYKGESKVYQPSIV